MTITFVNDSATISTSEYSFPADTTTAVPVAQTDDCILQVFADVSAMAAGDEFRFRIYEKVNAGTIRVAYENTLVGAQANPVFEFPSMIVGDGWDVTALKVAGTDRAIAWSLRKIT